MVPQSLDTCYNALLFIKKDQGNGFYFYFNITYLFNNLGIEIA